MASLPEPLAALVRDHRLIDEVVGEARETIERASQHPEDQRFVAEAIERLRDLDAFADVDLALHIEKEEAVLFPVLRGLADEDVIVDEMLAQHDMIKERQVMLQRALAALDSHHDDVRAERGQLATTLQDAGEAPSAELLANLREIVRRLHAILQGHFGDEEDDLFGPAAELLAPEALARLAVEIAAIDRAAG